jgi:Protein of unknown function (DUF4239)
MYSQLIFLVTFVSIAIGGALGMLVRIRLPDANLIAESKEVVRLGAGLMGTVAALVLGLMIASAKNSYDTQIANVRQLTANIILLDELLEQYGPEANEARAMIRRAAAITVQRVWRENTTTNNTTFSPSSAAEQFFLTVEGLSPKNDVQRSIKPRILEVATDLARTRLLLFVHFDNPIPAPLLVIVILWLAVIFASFTLFVDANAVVAIASLVYALAVSSALFLIVDMSQPFTGLMKISNEPLRHVLPQLAS